MKHLHTRIAQLKEILAGYKYPLPFSEHLKQYFRDHKKAGSKDRRDIRALSYAFFRVANAMKDTDFENIVTVAAQLADQHGQIDGFLNEAENFDSGNIFPFNSYVSGIFENNEFQLSFLKQPSVWIRLKAGHEAEVMAELQDQNISFHSHSQQVLGLDNDLNLNELKSFKKGYSRIQDLSSQSVSDHFKVSKDETWWDCCAGSGGKSLGLLEQNTGIKLYASDIRESILNNLHQRLKIEGNHNVNIFAADVAQPIVNQDLPDFDGIIIDAPCSGSGTWARNPENLYYFDPESMAAYQNRQLAILNNVFPFVKTGRPLIYITCSVFKMENEEVIARFVSEHDAKIEEQKYLEGYRQSAENMFLCRMIKTS